MNTKTDWDIKIRIPDQINLKNVMENYYQITFVV